MIKPSRDVLTAIEGIKGTNISHLEAIIEWLEKSREVDLRSVFDLVNEKRQQQAIGSAKTLDYIISTIRTARDKIQDADYIGYITTKKAEK